MNADDARSAGDPTLRTLLRTADAHLYDLGPDGKTCGCGWERPYPMPEGVTINAAHAAHVAAEQAVALAARAREVEERAERAEAALTSLRETVEVDLPNALMGRLQEHVDGDCPLPLPAADEGHRMAAGSHERPGGPECRCGAPWDRWSGQCTTSKEAKA